MPQGQRQGDPDVSIEILLVGRAGRGIVVDVCPFDLRPVPLGGGVVDDRQQPLGQGQGPQQKQKKLCSDRFGLASKGGKEVIIVGEVVANTDGAEPSGHGATPPGEENARQQHRQSPAIACMQSGCPERVNRFETTAVRN